MLINLKLNFTMRGVFFKVLLNKLFVLRIHMAINSVNRIFLQNVAKHTRVQFFLIIIVKSLIDSGLFLRKKKINK